MELRFLGTGSAWGIPELFCPCSICRYMRLIGEERMRTSLALKGKTTSLLIDCGPDIKEQLRRNHLGEYLDGIIITHEHNDHYMGLDDLFPFKRVRPKNSFDPMPLYATQATFSKINSCFDYLYGFKVLSPHVIHELREFQIKEFAITPFKTYHGDSAPGSVGLIIRWVDKNGLERSLVYTSDFMDIPNMPQGIKRPDYLILQSFWLNEPKENRPKHMSFQRALQYIEAIDPQKAVYLVHIGDGDAVPNDPANNIIKKYEPKDPLRPPRGNSPYPIPRCQREWQETVDTILLDYAIDYRVYVAMDGLSVTL